MDKVKSKKVNLGCGKNWKLYPDYDGLDIIDYGQKYVDDVIAWLAINKEENSYDEVMANHFLEHFNQTDLQVIFRCVNDILKPGGIFKFVVPHLSKDRAFILSHKTFWNEAVARWLGEEEARDTYQFGSWLVESVVVNGRKDMHVRLRKV